MNISSQIVSYRRQANGYIIKVVEAGYKQFQRPSQLGGACFITVLEEWLQANTDAPYATKEEFEQQHAAFEQLCEEYRKNEELVTAIRAGMFEHGFYETDKATRKAADIMFAGERVVCTFWYQGTNYFGDEEVWWDGEIEFDRPLTSSSAAEILKQAPPCRYSSYKNVKAIGFTFKACYAYGATLNVDQVPSHCNWGWSLANPYIHKHDHKYAKLLGVPSEWLNRR